MIDKNFNTNWAKAAGIRAIKTMAQTAVAMLPATWSIEEVNWITIISTAGLAGIMSLLTSLAGLPEITDQEER